jgi:hypothetical protein
MPSILHTNTHMRYQTPRDAEPTKRLIRYGNPAILSFWGAGRNNQREIPDWGGTWSRSARLIRTPSLANWTASTEDKQDWPDS